MIADACLRAGAEEDITRDFAAYLDARGVVGEARAAMLESPQRLTIYRRLVRNSLLGVTYRLLARTRARMGEAFDESFDAFLEQRAPRTHFLKDVPSEFLAWVEPRWRSDERVLPHLLDLARYELAHFEIGAMPRVGEPRDLADVALDRPLAFSSVARLMRVSAAVQLLSEDLDDRSAPEPRSCALLLYRDDEHVVRVLELGPLAYEALARMFDGAPLGDAVREASAATKIDLTDELLAQFATLLADLGERGVLLGARAG
jgi:hypothetical protein